MKKHAFLLFLLMGALPNLLQAQSIRNGKDYALFFVTTEFNYWANFPKSTARQVETIAEELKGNYGFQTEIAYNLTRKQIIAKLSDYQKKAFGKKDQLLIYFSQHGHYEEGGTGALIPIDGLLNDPTYESWIRHPLLADLVNSIPCSHILLALDACYSGTFGGDRGKPTKPTWEKEKNCKSKVENALLHSSRFYVTSGGKERTPTNSKFADKFLEALRLKNDNGVLGFHKLFGTLTDAYPRPRFGNFKNHETGGDFVFVNQLNCNPIKLISDKEHWLTISEKSSINLLLQHNELYPNCPHKEKMRQYIGRVNSSSTFSKNSKKTDLENFLKEIKSDSYIQILPNTNGIKIIDTEFEEITESIQIKEASKKLIFIPPTYDTITENVTIRKQFQVPADFEPKWITVEEKVMIKKPSKQFIYIPAEFESINQTIIITPTFNSWSKKKVKCKREKYDNVLHKNHNFAVYKSIIQQILKIPASTKEEVIPAEYITVVKKKCTNCEKWKIINNGFIPIQGVHVIRPEYKSIKKYVVNSPAKIKEEVIPAEYMDIKKQVIKKNGYIKVVENIEDYKEIICN